MYVFFVFFLNDTATTETYTCRHTLTLPDSLPISRPTVRLTEISLNAAYSPAMVWSELSKISSTVACDTGLRADEPEKITSVSESPRRRLAVLSPITRSEEHTSELQSLMRISYAVLCLQKQKPRSTTTESQKYTH